jgi:two-component system sensor histidine kinase/response regulator
MMSTVVRNLLSNAIKFSKKGTSIRVTLENTEQSIVCTVSDSGVGIPSDKLSSIFELGIKKSSEGTSGEAGNGLGLFLCRSFVEKNGGTISVTSEPSNGTSVKFTIPRP